MRKSSGMDEQSTTGSDPKAPKKTVRLEPGKFGYRCLAGGCKSTTRDGFSIHVMPGLLPAEEQRFTTLQTAWIDFISRKRKFDDEDVRTCKRLFLCSGHFREEDYETSHVQMYKHGIRTQHPRLKKDAVPTVDDARQPFPPEWFVQAANVSQPSSSSLSSSSSMAMARVPLPTIFPVEGGKEICEDSEGTSQSIPVPEPSTLSPSDISAKVMRIWKSVHSNEKDIHALCAEYAEETEENRCEKKATDILEHSTGKRSSVEIVQQRVGTPKGSRSCEVQVKPETVSKGVQVNIFTKPGNVTAGVQYSDAATQTTENRLVPKEEEEDDDEGDIFGDDDEGDVFGDDDEGDFFGDDDDDEYMNPTYDSLDRPDKEDQDVKDSELSTQSQERRAPQPRLPSDNIMKMDNRQCTTPTMLTVKSEDTGSSRSQEVFEAEEMIQLEVVIKQEPEDTDVQRSYGPSTSSTSPSSDSTAVASSDPSLLAHSSSSNTASHTPVVSVKLVPALHIKQEFSHEGFYGGTSPSQCNDTSVQWDENQRNHEEGQEPYKTFDAEEPLHISINTDFSGGISTLQSSESSEWENSPGRNYGQECDERQTLRMSPDTDILDSKEVGHHTELEVISVKPFQCQYCDETFTLQNDLLWHTKIHSGLQPVKLDCNKHTGEMPQECHERGETFTNQCSLITGSHLQLHARENAHACQKCGKAFTSSGSPNDIKLHTESNLFNCEQCAKSSPTKEAFSANVHGILAKNRHECQQCGKLFPYRSSLIRHMEMHSGEKSHKCQECGKAFTQKSSLLRHKIVHTEEYPLTCICPECGKALCDRSSFVRHMKVHTREKLHKCPQCDKAFTRLNCLAQHLRSHTEKKQYKCQECGMAFMHRSKLRCHVRVHTGEKPYECQECGKAFAEQSSLGQHRITHTGEKPFKCQECDKRFTKRSSLVQHGRIHTREKPHICEECGKAFNHRSHLVHHRRLHTGEKPHQCQECGKAFTQRSTYVRHMRTHTGEKPYTCQECGEAFTNRSSLNHHIRVHTGEMPYICRECGEAFYHNIQLRRHMKLHTGEK